MANILVIDDGKKTLRTLCDGTQKEATTFSPHNCDDGFKILDTELSTW
jgi:hypothetical protein